MTSFQLPKERNDNNRQNHSVHHNNSESENQTTRRNENPRKRRHSQPRQPERPAESKSKQNRSVRHNDSANQTTRPNENPRKRRHSQPIQPEKPAESKIFHAEAAIKSLKRHMDKGTCPESLQYRARARIRADSDFKTDIKRIRKNAEQEVVKALTRFHHREIDRARVELNQSKRPKVEKTSTRNENCKGKSARSTPAANTDVTFTNVKEIATNIQASIAQFSIMMERLGDTENKQAEKYKCVFSDSNNNNRAKEKAKNNVTNRKRKERRKIKQMNQLNIQIEANRKHIKKPLK